MSTNQTRKRKTKSNIDDDAGNSSSDEKEQPVVPPVPPVTPVKSSKWADLITRASWSVVMVFAFGFLIWAGHVCLFALILVIQFALYSEICSLHRDEEKEKKLFLLKYLRWHFFVTLLLFTHGKSLKSQFRELIISNGLPVEFLGTHEFICFTLYIIGIVMFVLTLRKGYFRYLFLTFAWVHMTLLLVIFQTSWLSANLFNGLIWFVIPAFLVVTNDITAYLFGRAFGRTPLIALSPKKTWEGFIGATISTIIIGFVMATILSNYQYMICPKKTFDFSAVSCEPSKAFQNVNYHIPQKIANIIQIHTITAKPIQFHAVSFAIFASFIGPFGGFFASGIKRALKKKDFGDIIPGHGGVTDRFDCQILMSAFVFFYCQSFVFHYSQIGVEEMINLIITKMTVAEQMQVQQILGKLIKGS